MSRDRKAVAVDLGEVKCSLSESLAARECSNFNLASKAMWQEHDSRLLRSFQRTVSITVGMGACSGVSFISQG